MRDRILHEIAIICRAQGFEGDTSVILSKSPTSMASALRLLGVDNLIIGIVANWGDSWCDDEVLAMLKSINDTGTL
ncbi:hypothetical protein GO755_40110 [Spirosoma sp. HMF4905]|uniref:Uncharacterized protein n=1 Tax=Spirosoma arboris TaxID=2682092 RepID=A0A7K1SR60_9BACT|nr:hypothetical protein [Spirosoma arboris]MVM36281.1 hypothetical protein [Spirosoma arboris]